MDSNQPQGDSYSNPLEAALASYLLPDAGWMADADTESHVWFGHCSSGVCLPDADQGSALAESPHIWVTWILLVDASHDLI